jgi:hypothetical protein
MELFANPRQVRMQTNASRTGWFPYARERRHQLGRAAAAGRYCHPFRLDRAVIYYIARTGKVHITSGNDGLRCECDFSATDP